VSDVMGTAVEFVACGTLGGRAHRLHGTRRFG
jgi:hypothetical protein